jgi:hypothetical protein
MENQQETEPQDDHNDRSGNGYGFDEEHGVLPPASSMVNICLFLV